MLVDGGGSVMLVVLKVEIMVTILWADCTLPGQKFVSKVLLHLCPSAYSAMTTATSGWEDETAGGGEDWPPSGPD